MSCAFEKVLRPSVQQDVDDFTKSHKELSVLELASEIALTRGKMSQFKKGLDPMYGARFSSIEREEFMDLMPLRTVRVIGQGGHGRVFLVQSLINPVRLMAAKESRFTGPKINSQEKTCQKWRMFCRETSILQDIKHDNIVKYVSSVTCQSYGMNLMEFCPFGALSRHIGKLSLVQAERYFVQLTCAVRYLHELNIVHRDIKTDNILVREDTSIAVSDFGLSERLVEGECMVRGFPRTTIYMAPEVEVADGVSYVDGYKADAYSVGVVIWSMVSGKEPKKDTPLEFPDVKEFVFDPIIPQSMYMLLEENPVTRRDVVSLVEELVISGWGTWPSDMV